MKKKTKSLTERDRDLVWHPYTQMQKNPTSIGIVRGEKSWLYAEDGSKYLDAISSWWVNLHGHANPIIAKKVSEQILLLEHCIFAGFTHEPAIELAEKIISLLSKKNIQKIFYSDNGSTAVEVAIKMCIQYWKNKGETKHTIVALDGAYHGDTFGAMSVSEGGIFTSPFKDYLFEIERIPFPSDCKKTIESFQNIINRKKIAVLIVEPLIQGAAGMRMYSPDVLEELFHICKKENILIIADEVMTGFGRTGKFFATDYIETQPDIICLSKGITGGTFPLGVTACTNEIYDAFLSSDNSKTLFHGHSYTANPLACSAAIASMDLLLAPSCQECIAVISSAMKKFATKLSSDKECRKHIKDIRTLGTILAIEIEIEHSNYLSSIKEPLQRFYLSKGILLRPLGNIVYILPPYCILEEELALIFQVIEESLKNFEDIISLQQ